MAAQQPAPAAPPAAATPLSPDEAEFERLATTFEERRAAGDAAGAAAVAERLAALGEKLLGADHPTYISMVEEVLGYLLEQERRAELLPIAERMHRALTAALGPDDPRTVAALMVLSNAIYSSGDFARADPLMPVAVAQAEKAFGRDDPATLIALNNFGVLRLQQGRFGEAEELLQRALTARERVLGADHEETLDTLLALGLLYQGQQRFDEAEPVLQRLLDGRTRIKGAQHPETVMAVNALAGLHFARGEAAEAERHFRSALAASAALGDAHPTTLDALEGLAGALLLQARGKEAAELAERAFPARERTFGPSHPATLRSLSVLATAYLATDRPAEAEPLFARAMAESEKRLGNEHPDFLLAAENVVAARLSANVDDPRALDPARRLLAGARARRGGEASQSVPRSGDLRGRRGARWYTMFADAAVAAAAADPAQREQLLAEVFVALQEAVAGEASASIARMAVRRYAERQGGDLAGLVAEREQLTEQWRRLSEQIAQSFNTAGDGADAVRTQLRGERDRVQARMEQVDERIKARFPEYFQLVRPGAVSGGDTQRLLGPDDAILIAVPGTFGTHVLAVTRERAEWARSDWTQRETADAVARLRFDAGAQVDASPEQLRAWEAERPADGRPSFDRKVAYQLYTALVQPVEPALAGKKRIYVIAGESLAALPFSMLVTAPPTGADDDPAALRATPWLAERYALVHVPSIMALGLLRGAGRDAAPGGFVGFGDPAFEGKATSRGAMRGGRRGVPAVSAEDVVTPVRTGWGGLLANVGALRALEQLPGTARELKAMGDIFGASASRIFTRAGATEAQVRTADLSKARVVAFATHGLTPTDAVGEASASELFELAEPGLVLTPPAEASEADDGFLSASEVATLKLDADWVILSACNTASGDAATAGLSQLARAFFYAGARSLLASHWPVDDDVAARMTVRTLALEQAGTPRAEAFQQAMREIRSDPAHPEWAHPFYWSPFVLIGDGGK
jgi:CHAT domain-containing protein/tetratricopeptide (TPR) repeat protein